MCVYVQRFCACSGVVVARKICITLRLMYAGSCYYFIFRYDVRRVIGDVFLLISNMFLIVQTGGLRVISQILLSNGNLQEFSLQRSVIVVVFRISSEYGVTHCARCRNKTIQKWLFTFHNIFIFTFLLVLIVLSVFQYQNPHTLKNNSIY